MRASSGRPPLSGLNDRTRCLCNEVDGERVRISSTSSLGLSQGSNHVELNQSVADPRDKPEDDVGVSGKVRIHLVTPRRHASAGFRLRAGMTEAENTPAKEILPSSMMLLAPPG